MPMHTRWAQGITMHVQVCKVKELEHWQLYLVDWGYNTEAERQQAAANPRVNLVNLEQLQNAVKSEV
jgi:hypothetical protein